MIGGEAHARAEAKASMLREVGVCDSNSNRDHSARVAPFTPCRAGAPLPRSAPALQSGETPMQRIPIERAWPDRRERRMPWLLACAIVIGFAVAARVAL